MNALLAASTPGISNAKGSWFKEIATALSTGRSAADTAVLLVTSVRKTIAIVEARMTKKIGMSCACEARLPTNVCDTVSLNRAR